MQIFLVIQRLIATIATLFRKMPAVRRDDTDYTDYHAAVTPEIPEPEQAPLPEMTPSRRMAVIVTEYMKARSYWIDRNPNNGNIVYLTGMNPDFTLNDNRTDEWNDLRCIVQFDERGIPDITFSAVATTAPGFLSIDSTAARRLGGAAMVSPGQYVAWIFGYHKGDRNHPALVQRRPITIRRDRNNDGSDRNEMAYVGYFGINQHSTKPGFRGKKVGAWSAGCLVGKDFSKHMEFLGLVKGWQAVTESKELDYLYPTTIIEGKSLLS